MDASVDCQGRRRIKSSTASTDWCGRKIARTTLANGLSLERPTTESDGLARVLSRADNRRMRQETIDVFAMSFEANVAVLGTYTP